MDTTEVQSAQKDKKTILNNDCNNKIIIVVKIIIMTFFFFNTNLNLTGKNSKVLKMLFFKVQTQLFTIYLQFMKLVT